MSESVLLPARAVNTWLQQAFAARAAPNAPAATASEVCPASTLPISPSHLYLAPRRTARRIRHGRHLRLSRQYSFGARACSISGSGCRSRSRAVPASRAGRPGRSMGCISEGACPVSGHGGHEGRRQIGDPPAIHGRIVRRLENTQPVARWNQARRRQVAGHFKHRDARHFGEVKVRVRRLRCNGLRQRSRLPIPGNPPDVPDARSGTDGDKGDYGHRNYAPLVGNLSDMCKRNALNILRHPPIETRDIY